MVFDGKDLSPFEAHLLEELGTTERDADLVDGPTPIGAGGHHGRGRRVGTIVIGAFAVLVIALGGLAVTSKGHHPGDTETLPGPAVDDGAATQQVLAALARTSSAGGFDVAYRFSETPAATPPTTDCQVSRYVVTPDSGDASSRAEATTGTIALDGPARPSCSVASSTSVTGSGSVTMEPKTMNVSADIGGGGLQVTLRLEGDQVWEYGGVGYGTTDGPSGPGQPLSGFASLVTGTLGAREGNLAMTRMASPNAYLSIEQATVDSASEVGTGTVDGVAVTNYDVTIDLDQLASMDGLTADERATIAMALDGLHAEGYTSTHDTISVDDAGLIRRVVSVSSFGDGGTVTFDASYSNFACATTTPSTCPELTTPSSASSPPDVPESTTTTAVPFSSTTSSMPTSTIAPTTTAPRNSATPTTSGG